MTQAHPPTAAGRACARVRFLHEVDGVPGTRLAQALDADDQPVPGPRIAIMANMHGNEPVGALVLERLEPMLPDQLLKGEVLIVVANVEAVRLGRRHTPEGTDLNRLWDAATQRALRAMPEAERCYEHRRALELGPLLQTCDAILDLHSTSQPAPPFLVIRDDQQHALLVRHLGVEKVVTGLHEDGILGGGVGPDVGLLLGERSGRIGVTFEAGQHSDPDNRKRAFEVAVRFLDHFGLWRLPPPPSGVEPHVFEVIDRFRQAAAGAEPFVFPGWTAGSGGTLASGRPLASFQPVEAGEELLRRGAYHVVRAPSPFTILLPTPTADPGTDLYYMAVERRMDTLATDGQRTDAQAHIEADAIERMLDVLSDDELERGTTWVSFHRRQVLDVAADVVLRALRLPDDHPHRRIAVVGRGDWGGSASEVRAGRRYRQAFRRAVASGMPLDRYQFLRGASRGWLDVLTSDAMGRLFEERARVRRAAGVRGSGLRLFLSAQRPSTVGLLVIGDPERALRDGDYRHARVGVIIEAPVVEPDGDSATVKVQRFGLFSARPAFLKLASRLLGTLRSEHAALVRQAPLADDPALLEVLGPGDAIVPPSDAAHLVGLGAALHDLQLRLWRDALRYDVPHETLRSADDVGPWLTRTMTRTGVLDPDSVKHLLLDGLQVDPRRLDDPPPLPPLAAVTLRTRIRPPLTADDADADTLARWTGWKRFVHQRQAVPDTRGLDVDLQFDERDLAERLVRWFDETRALAAQRPGRVQLVVAGNGLPPAPPGTPPSALVEAHTRVLLDPNVRYLRIQHARGSYLRWLKGLVETLRHRPAGGAPAGLRFEGEHGASINVILLAVHDGDSEPDPSWTLDGWRLERCAALVTSLPGGIDGTRVGVFTEPLAQTPPNAELLQFARAHCQGLLLQGGPPTVEGDADLAEFLFVERIARWIDRARDLTDTPFPVPQDPAERAPWLQDRLGLADPDLVAALVREMDRDTPARPVARALWDVTVPWPEL